MDGGSRVTEAIIDVFLKMGSGHARATFQNLRLKVYIESPCR